MNFVPLFFALSLACFSQIKKESASSLSKNEELVVKHLTDEKIYFKVAKDSHVYLSRTGSNVLTGIAKGQKVELLAFDERAYKVKFPSLNGSAVGWVSPHALASDDPDFIENFKKTYERELLVRKLIEDKQVAIGMTDEEVREALGKPTKTTSKRTAAGTEGRFEYTEKETVKHYQTVYDHSGRPYQQLTHTTDEVRSQTVIEFTDGTVSSIEESENHEPNRTYSTVARPIYSRYNPFTFF